MQLRPLFQFVYSYNSCACTASEHRTSPSTIYLIFLANAIAVTVCPCHTKKSKYGSLPQEVDQLHHVNIDY